MAFDGSWYWEAWVEKDRKVVNLSMTYDTSFTPHISPLFSLFLVFSFTLYLVIALGKDWGKRRGASFTPISYWEAMNQINPNRIIKSKGMGSDDCSLHCETVGKDNVL